MKKESKNNTTWLTPRDLVEALGPFDLDPCCPPVMPWPTADRMIMQPANGLAESWEGCRVWLNPPYGGGSKAWMRKMAKVCTLKEDGVRARGIALVFARTCSSMFHDYVFPVAHSILFLRGRLRFCYPNGDQAGSALAPSCLISYSEEDTASLSSLMESSAYEGRLVLLSESETKPTIENQ